MPSTFSTLKIQLMATGENNTTWGDVTNLNLGTALEEAIVGSADVTFASADVTLTLTDTNASQTARNMRLRCTGTTGGSTRNLIVPAIEKPYIVSNDCADSIIVKNTTGTGITVPAGKTMWVYNNATNVVDAVTNLSSLTLGTDLAVSDGGTGASTFTANGVIYGNTTSALLATAAGTTGQVLVGNTGGAPSWSTLSGIGVTSFSAGTTGLTPSTATTGAITLAGTLGVANGGTGTTTAFTAGSVVFAGASGVYSQDNANLFWDDTNDRLGIGTASPAYKLDVNGVTRLGAGSPAILAGVGGAFVGGQGELYTVSTNTMGLGTTGAASMQLYTNSVERMRITNAGDFGIGTSSPTAKLTVNDANNIPVRMGDIAAAPVSQTAVYVGVSTSALSGGNGDLVLIPRTSDARSVLFYTGNGTAVERMRIDSAGNVGVGETAPSSALQVNGNIRVSNGTGFATGNSLIRSIQSMSGSSNQFVSNSIDFYTAAFTDNGQIAFSTGGVEAMRINGSSNVGIGTTAPVGRLDAVSASATGNIINARNTSSSQFFLGGVGMQNGATANNSAVTIGTGVRDADGTDSFFTINKTNSAGSFLSELAYYDLSAEFWRFSTNGSERARIDSSGNFFVGTTTTTTQSGVVAVPDTAGGASAIIVGHANGVGSGNSYAVFSYNAGIIGSITQSGTTAVGYNTTSDARLKKNVANADDAASLIDALQVRKFDWKSDDSHQRYGFVAQELLEVAPEAVHQPEDPEEMMGVDYSKLVPMLVKELQSVRARLAKLEGN